MKELKLNAEVTATKTEKGLINLSINLGDMDNISIKVNDFGGKRKRKARLLTYKIYKKLGGE